jgi:hypothetical protein
MQRLGYAWRHQQGPRAPPSRQPPLLLQPRSTPTSCILSLPTHLPVFADARISMQLVATFVHATTACKRTPLQRGRALRFGAAARGIAVQRRCGPKPMHAAAEQRQVGRSWYCHYKAPTIVIAPSSTPVLLIAKGSGSTELRRQGGMDGLHKPASKLRLPCSQLAWGLRHHCDGVRRWLCGAAAPWGPPRPAGARTCRAHRGRA